MVSRPIPSVNASVNADAAAAAAAAADARCGHTLREDRSSSIEKGKKKRKRFFVDNKVIKTPLKVNQAKLKKEKKTNLVFTWTNFSSRNKKQQLDLISMNRTTIL